jgi:hypothetical protein
MSNALKIVPADFVRSSATVFEASEQQSSGIGCQYGFRADWPVRNQREKPHSGSIKFQKSENIGSSWKATQADVDDAIYEVERVIVVDIRQFPELSPLELSLALVDIRATPSTAEPGPVYG